MNITYYGHSAIKLSNDKNSMIIDPFLLDNPRYEGALKDIGWVDHILVTHGHHDHLGDALELAKINDAIIVTNPEIADYLSQYGVKTLGVQPSSYIDMPFGRLKCTTATHTSSISTPQGKLCGGMPFGFIVEIDGKRVYHAGDTGLFYDMHLMKDDNIDVAILPIGGFYTMDIDDAIKSVNMIQPKSVIPVHYDTFDKIKADPEVFKNKCAKRTIILKPGEAVSI